MRDYREVVRASFACCHCLILSAMGCFAPGGWDRPRKALSPFCRSIAVQWIIYVTPGGPLDSFQDWTTQDSVREPWGQGPAEEPWGIIGDPEVTSKGKLNDKNQNGGVGAGEWTFIHRFVERVYVCASIYRGCYTHAQINSHGNTHLQDPHHWFTHVSCGT